MNLSRHIVDFVAFVFISQNKDNLMNEDIYRSSQNNHQNRNRYTTLNLVYKYIKSLHTNVLRLLEGYDNNWLH